MQSAQLKVMYSFSESIPPKNTCKYVLRGSPAMARDRISNSQLMMIIYIETIQMCSSLNAKACLSTMYRLLGTMIYSPFVVT
jgi:hypothetical protein